MTSIVQSLQGFFEVAVGMVTDLAEAIVSDPLLTLLVVIVPLTGFAVGLIRRIINL